MIARQLAQTSIPALVSITEVILFGNPAYFIRHLQVVPNSFGTIAQVVTIWRNISTQAKVLLPKKTIWLRQQHRMILLHKMKPVIRATQKIQVK